MHVMGGCVDMHVLGVKMQIQPLQELRRPRKVHILFLLNFCNSFHEFNSEMRSFLKVNNGMESGKF